MAPSSPLCARCATLRITYSPWSLPLRLALIPWKILVSAWRASRGLCEFCGLPLDRPAEPVDLPFR